MKQKNKIIKSFFGFVVFFPILTFFLKSLWNFSLLFFCFFELKENELEKEFIFKKKLVVENFWVLNVFQNMPEDF